MSSFFKRIPGLLKEARGNALWEFFRAIGVIVVGAIPTIIAFIKTQSWWWALAAMIIGCAIASVIISWMLSWLLKKQIPPDKPIVEEGRIDVRRRIRQKPDISRPIIGESNEEVQRQREIQRKKDRLSEAMRQLWEKRMELKQEDAATYEASWNGQMDPFTKALLQSVENIVRETFGDFEANKFIASGGFKKVSANEEYPGYCQTLMDLEQYELRLSKLIDDLR